MIGMSIEEAIRFMKEEVNYMSYVAMKGGSVYEARIFEKKVNQIIDLLKYFGKLGGVVHDPKMVLLKSHQETGTIISKERMDHLDKGAGFGKSREHKEEN